MKRTGKILLFSVLAASWVGCTSGQSNQPNVELIQDMMDQPAIKAQDYEPGEPSKSAMRYPPEGTVPTHYKPYPYHLNPQAAEQALRNPLTGDMSPEVLLLGQRKYEIYCAVCHGAQGKGDGPVAPKMALQPPSVVSEKVKAFNDGRIYHIITDGQGVMGSYATQIWSERERWAIVNYVRSLQKLSN